MSSRQAAYQARMRAEGRCTICGKPEETSGRCSEHYAAELQRRRDRYALDPVYRERIRTQARAYAAKRRAEHAAAKAQP